MSTQENIKIVRRAIEAVNTGDTSNVHEFINPEYVNRESQKHKDSFRSQLNGPEEFIDTIKNLRGACPDLHFEEQEVIAQDNEVAFVGNVTGLAIARLIHGNSYFKALNHVAKLL